MTHTAVNGLNLAAFWMRLKQARHSPKPQKKPLHQVAVVGGAGGAASYNHTGAYVTDMVAGGLAKPARQFQKKHAQKAKKKGNFSTFFFKARTNFAASTSSKLENAVF